jgi:hypothetical protein
MSVKYYRYMGNYVWFLIQAHDDADALKQAQRMLPHGTANREHLQVWNGKGYVSVAQSCM